ncbi:Ssna1 [Symbiodinium sp. CCMP2592]|nr:Ssna1 [Symbiodinium sp. CCMP2592]
MAAAEEGKTDLAHALEKLLRRPLTSEDVAYDTSEDINALEPSFQSSVTVRLDKREFTRQAAGHSAANSQHNAAMNLLKDWAEVQAHADASQENPDVAPAEETPATRTSEGATSVESDGRSVDYKSMFSKLMQKVLGRSATKDDVQFQTVELQPQSQQSKPIFQSTVILKIGASERWTCVGEAVCGQKKAAEQNAARKALEECPELKPLYGAMFMPTPDDRSVCPALSNDDTAEIPDMTAADDRTAYPKALSNDDTTDSPDVTDGLAGDKRIEYEAAKPATVQVVSEEALPEDLRLRLSQEEVRIPHDLAELTEVEVEELGKGLKLGSIARLRRLHRGCRRTS